MSNLKKVSKNNFIFGLIGLFLVVPFFIYGFATVSYVSYKNKEISSYYLQFLFEPVILFLIVLLVFNIIADFMIYAKDKALLLKKILLFFNFCYIMFLVLKFIPTNGQLADLVFFAIAICILFYKVFRYYWYYKNFIKSQK